MLITTACFPSCAPANIGLEPTVPRVTPPARYGNRRAARPAAQPGRYAEKDKQNRRKHGVSFSEAEAVFMDEHALLLDDPEHSADEDRFILLGLGAKLRILVVVHSLRERQGVIRIISARKAIRRERDIYNQRWRL